VQTDLGVDGLVAVNVAQPEVIGQRRGKPVSSAIRKRHVATGGLLRLTFENLSGDRQADLRVHGGPDKAVYAYPSEHLPRWNTEFEPEEPFGPGAFGENLTTAGWLETDARIGDVWTWGEALLQVCQPRYPCFKLAMKLDRPRVVDRMLETGRTGWYLRVLAPGVRRPPDRSGSSSTTRPESPSAGSTWRPCPAARTTRNCASCSSWPRSPPRGAG